MLVQKGYNPLFRYIDQMHCPLVRDVPAAGHRNTALWTFAQ